MAVGSESSLQAAQHQPYSEDDGSPRGPSGPRDTSCFCPLYVFHVVYNFFPVAWFSVRCICLLLLFKAFLQMLLSLFRGSPGNIKWPSWHDSLLTVSLKELFFKWGLKVVTFVLCNFPRVGSFLCRRNKWVFVRASETKSSENTHLHDGLLSVFCETSCLTRVCFLFRLSLRNTS